MRKRLLRPMVENDAITECLFEGTWPADCLQSLEAVSPSRQLSRQMSRHVSKPAWSCGAVLLPSRRDCKLSLSTPCPRKSIGLNRSDHAGGVKPRGFQADASRREAAQECLAIFANYCDIPQKKPGRFSVRACLITNRLHRLDVVARELPIDGDCRERGFINRHNPNHSADHLQRHFCIPASMLSVRVPTTEMRLSW